MGELYDDGNDSNIIERGNRTRFNDGSANFDCSAFGWSYCGYFSGNNFYTGANSYIRSEDSHNFGYDSLTGYLDFHQHTRILYFFDEFNSSVGTIKENKVCS